MSVDNIGGMPVPVDLRAAFGDGTSEVIHQTPAVWAANARRADVAIQTQGASISAAERRHLDGCGLDE